MPIDKSWTHPSVKRTSQQFLDGLNAFIEMSRPHVNEEGKIRCACNHCRLHEWEPLEQMRYHIRVKGFSQAYANQRWSDHGEALIPPVVLPPSNEMLDVIDDVMAELITEDDTNLEEGASVPGGSGVEDGFSKLLEEVQKELYPGCSEFSSLDFLAKLMYIKVNGRWTDSSFDQLLSLLCKAFPKENKVPRSHYQAKKTLKKIGLGYESIHVCKNDCMLYWKDDKGLQYCRICNTSRWVDKNTKGKKIPHKVLRHFPVADRLRRMYCCRHTAINMPWHKTGRSVDGILRHPVDGTSWQEFDSRYPEFASEARNVRLGLAADGFNPFGNMCSPHSTWPVIFTTYNLPPWLCMKESSFMLTLLIPGPKSPGKDMDVFLRPVVDELKQLWETGIRVKDAATNEFFTMKAMLLWTINDFPARSSLSGWSGQGYKACPNCNEDTPSTRVTNKVVYPGHRRFLAANDPLRRSLQFNGQEERRPPPRKFSSEQIQAQLCCLLARLPGKHPDFGGRKVAREPFELNWSKKSIFFELEYWSSLQLKHNLDVMHIEKNVCDSVLGTLLQNEKTKDTPNARQDLENLGIRKNQWLQKVNGKHMKPPAPFSLQGPDRKFFCQFIRDVRLPDGFGSNISKRVFWCLEIN
jgi:hypothetical protein